MSDLTGLLEALPLFSWIGASGKPLEAFLTVSVEKERKFSNSQGKISISFAARG